MHVYLAPEPGNHVLRRCTVLLSLTQTRFHPAHISTPKGAYNACCHYRRKALPGASNPRLFGYESNTLTNCAITDSFDANRPI